ncbi:hypothetical protein [Dokdonella sp.]|uniref:hypothetical protein n=1 Tax=Dokdonella sp. TaxID=2291710 RepID=UPI0031C6D6F4|nr:hypothetical protein [Dokdonella sp.]
MTHENGIVLPLSSEVAEISPIIVSKHDIAAMGGFTRLHRALCAALQAHLGDAQLLGSEIVIPLVSDGSHHPYCASALASDLDRTARELEANAAREHPLAHRQVITVPQLVPVLHALSAIADVSKTNWRMLVRTDSGDVPAPVLPASAFIESVVSEQQSIRGPHPIFGILRNEAGYVLLLANGGVAVSPPDVDGRLMPFDFACDAVKSHAYIDGAIVRDNKKSPWRLVSGARIVPGIHQSALIDC